MALQQVEVLQGCCHSYLFSSALQRDITGVLCLHMVYPDGATESSQRPSSSPEQMVDGVHISPCPPSVLHTFFDDYPVGSLAASTGAGRVHCCFHGFLVFKVADKLHNFRENFMVLSLLVAGNSGFSTLSDRDGYNPFSLSGCSNGTVHNNLGRVAFLPFPVVYACAFHSLWQQMMTCRTNR